MVYMGILLQGYWRSMLNRLGANRSFATSTPPRMKQVSSTFDTAHGGQSKLRGMIKLEFAPVYVVVGMVLVVVGMAVHTAKQQLLHAPAVTFSKKKRGNMAEVYDPDAAFESANKFLTKSFLRKVAHIQDNEKTISDPMRGDAFSRYA